MFLNKRSHQQKKLWTAIIFGLALAGCSNSSDESTSQSEQTDNTSENIGDTESNINSSEQQGADRSFVTFESGQVRPMAVSADGTELYVTNTPSSTLEIFAITPDGLEHSTSVGVGLEPVALAVDQNDHIWVVNHVSDSISIVNPRAAIPQVEKTLLVGDEPRDIVFAGDNNSLAFITTAHRGQNGPDDNPIDAELHTPGAGRTDLWIFDVNNTGNTLGGDPLNVVSFFGDTARSLSTSPNGQKVYVAVMNSGNRTTAIGENLLAKSGPVQSSDNAMQPDTGLIVQFDGDNWVDEYGNAAEEDGRDFNSLVTFSLPDNDVFEISASADPELINTISGVGTTLFNMATNPVTGSVYVSNTDALNVNRFEGMGETSSTVRGNFARNQVSVIAGNSVQVHDLNHHLDHSQSSATLQQKRDAVAQPVGMSITEDGQSLYIAGFGSQKVVVYDTATLEDINTVHTATPTARINLSAGGPTGVTLDEQNNRLYVLTRFNNGISIIDTTTHAEIANLPMSNPEPAHVIAGRQFLYNAEQHSSHGDMSCAICHTFGDTDMLAWDLGNPDATVVANPNQFVNRNLSPDEPAQFHPLKGPMTTQSLRGLRDAGPMHWRGDRTGANAQPGNTLELAAFREFNIAFPELLGSDAELTDQQMTDFARFALEITYPPNPIRALDNSLNPRQRAGRDVYFNDPTTGTIFTCNECHVLAPEDGHFGTSGLSSIEGDDISQEFKVPHLRNAYQKVGKFGNSGRFSASDQNFGEQIRGFGFMHDGNMDTLDNFFQASVFKFSNNPVQNQAKRNQVVEFVMAFDSNLAPIVGQQVTIDQSTGSDTDARVDLLLERGLINSPRAECDLLASGVINGSANAYLLQQDGSFLNPGDSSSVSYQELLAIATATDETASAITFTCFAPGTGVTMLETRMP